MGKKLFSCRHPSSPAIKVKTESQPGICQCLLGPKGRFLCPISPKPHQRRTRKEKIEEQRKRKEGEKIAMVALLVFILATFLAENKTA